MKKKLHLLILLFIIGLSACESNKNQFTVIGLIREMPEMKVYLEELKLSGAVIIDSTSSDNKGHFELKGTASEPGLYRINFSSEKYILISTQSEEIKIQSNWKQLEDYDINGSPSSSSLSSFIGNFRNYINDIRTLGIIMDSMRIGGKDSLLEVAQNDMQNTNRSLTTYIQNYADTTAYLPNALFAVQILNPNSEKPFIDNFIQKLISKHPQSTLAKEFVAKYTKGSTSATNNGSNTFIGNMAPDFKLKQPDNTEISLSSFRGKFVLLDFWASWCTPCRKENPNVAAAYRSFKDRNFTILGVSLDDNKEKWTKAIEADKLVWTNVSDLKGWESDAAKMYNITSIPSNFLIDPSGKIIATDLKGADLEHILNEVLK
jgi:peroxiredoxin